MTTTTTSNIRPIHRTPAHKGRDTKSGSDDVIQIQHGCLLFYLVLQSDTALLTRTALVLTAPPFILAN